MLKAKLGLVKDTGVAFVKGASSGFAVDAVGYTALSVVLETVVGEKDYSKAISTAAKVIVGTAAFKGVLNAAIEADVIAENYRIRKEAELNEIPEMEFEVVSEEE